MARWVIKSLCLAVLLSGCSEADAFVAVIFALLALLFAFVLLLVIGRIGGGRTRRTT